MNKRDLIDAISGRLGDKKSATEAVNAVLETIQSAVATGDKVAITGFGVFEKSERPARTARNPATGATIQVPKSSVPKFRAGCRLQGPRQRRQARPEIAGPKPASRPGPAGDSRAGNREPTRPGPAEPARRPARRKPAGPVTADRDACAARSG